MGLFYCLEKHNIVTRAHQPFLFFLKMSAIFIFYMYVSHLDSSPMQSLVLTVTNAAHAVFGDASNQTSPIQSHVQCFVLTVTNAANAVFAASPNHGHNTIVTIVPRHSIIRFYYNTLLLQCPQLRQKSR